MKRDRFEEYINEIEDEVGVGTWRGTPDWHTAMFAKSLVATAKAKILGEFDRLTKENERMRPIFEAAMNYEAYDTSGHIGVALRIAHGDMLYACRKAREDGA